MLEPLEDWETRLRRETRPIILYGMGDGAEKIHAVLTKRGIRVDGVMASDEYLRSQSFLGFRVIGEAEAERIFGDFVAVLCFALRGELTKLAVEFSKRHTLISPNIAVCGDEVCDKSFILKNINRFSYIFDRFADDESKKVFLSVMKYNITGDVSHLFSVKSERHTLDPRGRAFVDVGAYDGDTVLELVLSGASVSKIVAFEPDKKSFSKLVANTKSLKNIECINAAVGEKCDVLRFSSEGSMNSHLGEGDDEIEVKTIDSLGLEIGAIKIDAEGYDREVLYGAVNTITTQKPQISCAVYHRAGDIYDISRLILFYDPSYRLFLRKIDYIPAWDIFITAK